MSDHTDPFRDAREKDGISALEFSGETIPFILGLKDVRKSAKNWQEFSSNHPFKVVPVFGGLAHIL